MGVRTDELWYCGFTLACFGLAGIVAILGLTTAAFAVAALGTLVFVLRQLTVRSVIRATRRRNSKDRLQ
jgi:hypothetical protein